MKKSSLILLTVASVSFGMTGWTAYDDGRMGILAGILFFFTAIAAWAVYIINQRPRQNGDTERKK